MKVIFLDIDGVLNSRAYDRVRDWNDERTFIDKTRLPLVKEIVDKTGALIVLSTTWRRHWNQREELRDITGKIMVDIFSEGGLDIYDKTPSLGICAERHDEVKQWLDDHEGEVESFVIIDDYIFGWKELNDNFVRTEPNKSLGLCEEQVQKAIAILNGEATN